MKMRYLLLVAALIMPVASFAQQTKTIEKGNQIMMKINRLDIVKFVLPLILKKKQIGDLMAGMEKCRAKELEIRELDAKELEKVDAEITKAIDDAIKDGNYPNKEFQAKIARLTGAIAIRRSVATGEMVSIMFDVCSKTLDAGQMKAMGNLVDPKAFDPSLKVDKMTDEDRQRLYIKLIMLDGTTYELMKQLIKYAE